MNRERHIYVITFSPKIRQRKIKDQDEKTVITMAKLPV